MMSDLQKSLLFPHPQNLSTFKRLCNFAVSERALCFHYKSYLEGGQLCGRYKYRNLISKVCLLSSSFLLIHACIPRRFSHVLTLCDPMDCSLPDSSVHGISQATILEWVVIASSRGSSRSRDQTRISCVSCIAGSLPAEPSGKPQYQHTKNS